MSGLAVDKNIIAQNFSVAADGYDAEAVVQAKIAKALARRLPCSLNHPTMVDLGCGSGLLSGLLLERYPMTALIGIDLAEGMVAHCRRRWAAVPRANFIAGDAEDARLLVPGAGLVACSCAAQWFADPSATLQMWMDALASGGLLAVALPVEGSFRELESAYREALCDRFRGLCLPAIELLPSLLPAAGMKLLASEMDCVQAVYDSSLVALRSFQRIGAVFQGQPGYQALGLTRTRRLLACYDRQGDGAGRATVTYRIQYLIAEKTR
jgi:malonyl-CoA O-methyltransferase